MNPKAMHDVCSDITSIMDEYRRQESSGRMGTPGGLEHMGDVWRMLRAWDEKLRKDPTP